MIKKQQFNFSTGIVVPCYNEAERLQLTEFSEFFKVNENTYFCFVNDGSIDETKNILADFVDNNEEYCQVVHLPYNQGKAEAVRQGITTLLKKQKFKFVGFWDADLATPLSTLHEFIEIFQSNSELVVVCGSRILRLGASIRRSTFRHYFGRVFATIASNILKIPVYDTQCGAKIFRIEHAELIFSKIFLSAWFFDIELFARTIELMGRQKTISSIYEVPLRQWHDKGDSKVSWGSMIRTPVELLKIYFYYRNRIAESK
ncbi:MAG: glycosyltransferase [SAR324 cluster bacterium]|nr:glycosyltransferase [SAR324 cluster bacterium]